MRTSSRQKRQSEGRRESEARRRPYFHLQDGPRKEKSWGINPVFEDVTLLRDRNPPARPARRGRMAGRTVGD
jgi:hypothetical protein